ncbi:hypothetical protein [Kribbella capetownensis]|uniref:hypothetical protein n=1 Tax=Kribbella capetownensis TaxID=1572659 RepID=UPI0013F40A64|nr:hypothetical protein [Kribbella capetownensis]
MQLEIVKTVAIGTIAALGLAAVAFTPAAYASTTNQTATPHLVVLTDPVQLPTRKAA